MIKCYYIFASSLSLSFVIHTLILHINKHRAILNPLIKLIVGLGLLWVLYQEVFTKEDLPELVDTFIAQLSWQQVPWLIAAILLMPVNWAFETGKWRQLSKRFEPMDFWKGLQTVLGGVTFSLFTPNRIGEYGGRILFVRAENNWKGVIATLVGSFSQLLILLGLGLAGLVAFTYLHLPMELPLLGALVFLSILLVGLLFFGFFNIDLVIPLARRIPFIHYLRRFVKDLVLLRNYESNTLSKVLFYAFLRYLTYALQYYLMIRYFGIEVNIINGLVSIATIFLLQTSIPLPPLMGLLVRGKVALHIWGFYGANELSILAATFSLWLLNLILPALLGLIFIVNVNVLKSLGYEEREEELVEKTSPSPVE